LIGGERERGEGEEQGYGSSDGASKRALFGRMLESRIIRKDDAGK